MKKIVLVTITTFLFSFGARAQPPAPPEPEYNSVYAEELSKEALKDLANEALREAMQEDEDAREAIERGEQSVGSGNQLTTSAAKKGIWDVYFIDGDRDYRLTMADGDVAYADLVSRTMSAPQQTARFTYTNLEMSKLIILQNERIIELLEQLVNKQKMAVTSDPRQ